MGCIYDAGNDDIGLYYMIGVRTNTRRMAHGTAGRLGKKTVKVDSDMALLGCQRDHKSQDVRP